ncbi:hypothetical protein [Edaphobacter modestus]|uniref:Uncharacterized protein n=1 Tax=Edaphobacter modestus TaxID=388466 RepID=A0A4Q7YZ03_9BACT|nr:hypothetical protein [Edaphobacter modestus]RZU43222.1 hypothetical protein BDD14_4857 [Edaphobacter modestus]
MTETVSNYFVFLVLPTIFIAVWSYILLYNRRVKKRIKQIEASGRHLTSEEEGISLVTLEKERTGRIGGIS